jgi:tripartite-type tricarboxylate transporter receptor subunit TctC
VGEFVPGYEASVWYGIGAPRNTPVEVIDKLNKEINAALADPKMKARLAHLGGAVLALSPADFGKWAKADVDQVAVADAHTYNDEAGTVSAPATPPSVK